MENKTKNTAEQILYLIEFLTLTQILQLILFLWKWKNGNHFLTLFFILNLRGFLSSAKHNFIKNVGNRILAVLVHFYCIETMQVNGTTVAM